MRVLVVEDNRITSLDIVSFLKKEGYDVVGSVSSFEDVLKIYNDIGFDFVFMDIHLGDNVASGMDAAVEIRRRGYLGEIFFLTSYTDDENINRAVAVEPIGYLSKPFKREDLKVALEMARGKKSKSILKEWCFGPSDKYRLDSVRRCIVDVNMNAETRLTKRELDLLQLLVLNKGSIVQKREIVARLWGEDSDGRSLRQLVSLLNRKLPFDVKIKNTSSLGYGII